MLVRQELPSIRVLLIEDDEDDFVLLDRLLGEVRSARYEVTWMRTYESGLEEIDRGGYDICLLDYHLGAKDGLEILARVAKSATAPPIIVLTGQGDYLVDLRAMEYGAADYLVKDLVSGPLLERTIRYSIDRLKSKKALLESETQLKHLASALLKVQENERRMVAAELHDDFGQLLTAIKFDIESILVRMVPGDGCASDLRELIPSIQGAVERIRNMYTQLMPTVLDDLGILATLRWFCREFQKDHPDIEVDSEFGVREHEVAPDLKLVIFRIVQDALKNVAAHSGASRLRVSLIGKDEYLSLDIGDNGKGFDTVRAISSANNHGGLGLMSMKRRAELSGGSLRIESAEGAGTLVSVRWPIEAQGFPAG
ncbi:MAG: response regulator [Deltaproteobacteria bacterium]|jgi:signal transduction histidine kinase|nr:response regulator [Deltaproteobacteria bacterium]